MKDVIGHLLERNAQDVRGCTYHWEASMISWTWHRFVPVLLVTATLAAATFAGCSHRRRDQESLIVVSGAKDVKYGSLAGTRQVYYTVTDPYPGKETLAEISKQLAKQGWKPLRENFQTSKPSSRVRGWTHFLDGTDGPDAHVDQWEADWRDPAGDIVSYFLRYRSPVGSPANTTRLEVHGAYIPRDVARKMTKR